MYNIPGIVARVANLLEQHAEAGIRGCDFQSESRRANGWILNSQEELLCCRFFKEHFGELEHLKWMHHALCRYLFSQHSPR